MSKKKTWDCSGLEDGQCSMLRKDTWFMPGDLAHFPFLLFAQISKYTFRGEITPWRGHRVLGLLKKQTRFLQPRHQPANNIVMEAKWVWFLAWGQDKGKPTLCYVVCSAPSAKFLLPVFIHSLMN